MKSSKKQCPECNYPMVKLIKKGRKPQVVCLNKECPSKNVEGEKKEIEKKCPKCGSELVLRKSVYGHFIGCSNYPKCKYTEKINGNNNK